MRRNEASDAALAKRLARVETLFELHSAGIKPKITASILNRIAGVRAELERRAANEARLRESVRLHRESRS